MTLIISRLFFFCLSFCALFWRPHGRCRVHGRPAHPAIWLSLAASGFRQSQRWFTVISFCYFHFSPGVVWCESSIWPGMTYFTLYILKRRWRSNCFGGSLLSKKKKKNWWPSTDHLTRQWNLRGRSGEVSALIPRRVFTSWVCFIFLQIGSLNHILSFVSHVNRGSVTTPHTDTFRRKGELLSVCEPQRTHTGLPERGRPRTRL